MLSLASKIPIEVAEPSGVERFVLPATTGTCRYKAGGLVDAGVDFNQAGELGLIH